MSFLKGLCNANTQNYVFNAETKLSSRDVAKLDGDDSYKTKQLGVSCNGQRFRYFV